MRYALPLWILGIAQYAPAVPVTAEWITPMGNWSNAGNWTPSGVPGNLSGNQYTVLIGSRLPGAQVKVDAFTPVGVSVTSLTLNNGCVLTSDLTVLSVDGTLALSGQGTLYKMETPLGAPVTGVLTSAAGIEITDNALLRMRGPVLEAKFQLKTATGGALRGNGTVRFLSFDNSGIVGLPNALEGSPEFNTILTLVNTGVVPGIDLDGSSEAGVVDADGIPGLPLPATLVVNGFLTDSFNGTLKVGDLNKVSFTQPAVMTGAKVFLRGGGNFAAIQSDIGVSTGTLFATGTTFDISGRSVISNPLQLTGDANRFNVHSEGVLQLRNLTCPDAEAFVFDSGDTGLTVYGTGEVNDPAGNFTWPAALDVSGNLSLHVHGFLPANAPSPALNLTDNGSVEINVDGTSWNVPGAISKTGTGTGRITGDRVVLPTGGSVSVTGGVLELPATLLSQNSTINLSGQLSLGDGTEFNGPQFTATGGILRMRGNSSVTRSTAVNISAFLWDSSGSGGGTSTHTVADNAVFTINCQDFNQGLEIQDNIVIGGNAGFAVPGKVVRTTGTITVNAPPGTNSAIAAQAFTLQNGAAFNVNGRAAVNALFTTDTQTVTTIATGGQLTVQNAATWHGGTITGGGTLVLPPHNTVSANTTFDMAGLSGLETSEWDVGFGAGATIAPSGTQPGGPVSTLRGSVWCAGLFSINAGGPKLVREGVTKLYYGASWDGQALELGNDSGSLDTVVSAELGGTTAFTVPVTIKSDAGIAVDLATILSFNGPVTLDTVNGGNAAKFSGAGLLEFASGVNVNEAVTIDMPEGTMSLDGSLATGGTVHVDAPMVINALTFDSYGSLNTDETTDVIEVDNLTAGRHGSLAINLTQVTPFTPVIPWTLNGPGVISLKNGSTPATLLAGSSFNLNGTLNATGDVRTTARLLIGAGGNVNILTPGGALHIQGGQTMDSGNQIKGGTINGPGILKGDPGSLAGFGTVNAPVSFDYDTRLEAKDGTLTLNGPILQTGILSTVNENSVLDIPPAWDTAGVTAIFLYGGELKGGAMTVTNQYGVQGNGLISCPVINNTKIVAGASKLILATPLHNSDWDGTNNQGMLSAQGGDLEIRDNAPVSFEGVVEALQNRTFLASGFALNFMPASKIHLLKGRIRSSHGMSLGGSVKVDAGQDSSFQMDAGSTLVFKAGGTTTLDGSLQLSAGSVSIETGAVFTGEKSLIVPAGGGLDLQDQAVVNVILDNGGRLQTGNNAPSRVQVKEYRQSSAGELTVHFTGTAAGQYDKITVTGAAQISGRLLLKSAPGFHPAAGTTFDILTAATLTGTFTGVEQPADGSAFFEVSYLSGTVRLTAAATPPSFDVWAGSIPGLTNPADRTRTADPDGDGLSNLGEFALDGNPAAGGADGNRRTVIASVSGVPSFTWSVPIRTGAVPDPLDPAAGPLLLLRTADTLHYSLQASHDLSTWTLPVEELTGPGAVAVQAGLPALHQGWEYRTFHTPATGEKVYMRAVITE